MRVVESDRIETEKLQKTQELILAIVKNKRDLYDFAWRLHTRFRMGLHFADDGLPHAFEPKPVNIGAQPPYWAFFVYLEQNPRQEHIASNAVLDEGRALISQGIRLRNQMLGYFPDMPRECLFPLNLRSQR